MFRFYNKQKDDCFYTREYLDFNRTFHLYLEKKGNSFRPTNNFEKNKRWTSLAEIA